MRDRIMLAIAIMTAMIILGLVAGCSMSMGKTTYYDESGKVTKIEETKHNASTVQSVTTVFGVRIKTIAPTSSDAAPVELDLGLARNALQITPVGEKARIKTDWSGIMWWDTNKLDNDLSVNMDPDSLRTQTVASTSPSVPLDVKALSMHSAVLAPSSTASDLLDQGKEWISKPENQEQAKSWLSQAWTWISSIW